MNSSLLGLTWPLLILVFVGIFTSSQARCQDNGIGVGAPKVFDNHSLEVMLQQFEESLRTAQFVDKNQLAAAVGQFQGSQQTELSRDLELTVTPSPAAAPKSTPSSGQSQADKKAPSGTDTTKSSASDTSSAGMPDVVTKKYGIAAEDILSEQVNLTYQIFNLRMLLERSLSDRSFNQHPRLQSVLGFAVSLNPPKKHKGEAAVIEVRIPPIGNDPVSLVAMMPREKTYNVATLTSKVNQFGASAVAKIVNIGYTERRSGKTFFLVKDTDTFAFERNENSPGKKGTVVFGWVFRPVLNRPAVEAGTRQVFAVIALPASDSFLGQAVAPKTRIEVSTYWLPFNRKTATAKLESKKDSIDPLYSAEVQLYSAKQLQTDLSVKLTDLDWSEVGEAGALVNIYGDHLYNGTTAIVAGSVLANPANGLLLRNDHHLQVLTTIHELAQGGEINGRYGSPSPLEHPNIEQWKKEKGWGFYSNTWSWTPNPDRTFVSLVSRLTTKTLDAPPNLHGQKPIVTVGKRVIPPSRIGIYSHEPESDPKGDHTPYLQLTIDVPAESLASETLVDICVPFLGEDYHYVSPVYEPSRFSKVVRLREEGGKVVFGIIGARLEEAYELMIVADKTYTYDKKKPSPDFAKVSDGLLELKIDKQELSKIQQFVVNMDRKTWVIPVPAATMKPESAKPVITSPRPRVEVDSSVGVGYKGTDLNGIKKVSFEGDDLKFDAAKDGTSMTIFVTRKVTGKAGLVELIGMTEDGTLVRAELQIGGSLSKPDTEKK